jgi:hypothetical protein
MVIKDPVSTPMQEKTARALESANPFATPIARPRRLDGGEIVKEREPSIVSTTEQEEPPARSSQVSLSEEPEAIPDDVMELLRDQEEFVVKETAPIVANNATDDFQNPVIESRSTEGLPSYRCEFSGRDVFMGWPWYKTTNPVTAAVTFALGQDFGKDKLRMDMSIGDSKIEHARNRLAHKFLETDAKWLWMIDDDIIPSIGRPIWMRHWVHAARTVGDTALQRHVLHRLIGANKTLVAGAYFGRQEGGALMCSNTDLTPRAKAYEDAIVPVDWVATGCMLIHRKVFLSIREKFGDFLKIDATDYEYDYFRPFDSKGGEDVAFCKRAKQAGHQAHIDLGIPIYHVGYKTY